MISARDIPDISLPLALLMRDCANGWMPINECRRDPDDKSEESTKTTNIFGLNAFARLTEH